MADIVPLLLAFTAGYFAGVGSLVWWATRSAQRKGKLGG
jgi:hypothetical protein